jgi:hypothetical protein
MRRDPAAPGLVGFYAGRIVVVICCPNWTRSLDRFLSCSGPSRLARHVASGHPQGEQLRTEQHRAEAERFPDAPQVRIGSAQRGSYPPHYPQCRRDEVGHKESRREEHPGHIKPDVPAGDRPVARMGLLEFGPMGLWGARSLPGL